MKRILFVCHGNICRSPLAEFIFKKMARAEGVSEWYDIASAGISDEEEGNPVYPLARQELAQHGIGCVGKTARKITPADYRKYDMIVCMDRENLRVLGEMFPHDYGVKISLLMQHAGEERDVADPWYTRDFRAAWNDIHTGCKAIFDKFLPKAKAWVARHGSNE